MINLAVWPNPNGNSDLEFAMLILLHVSIMLLN